MPTRPSSSPRRRIRVIALIDEWRDADGTIQRRRQLRSRRHDAPRAATVLRRQAGHDRARDLRPGRHRAPPPPLRGQREVPHQRNLPGITGLGSGHHPAREAHWMVELPREVHPWFVGVQFHPEFSRRRHGTPPAVHQATSRRRCSTRSATRTRKPRNPRPGRLHHHATLRIRGRPDRPFFLIAGTCSIESLELSLDVAGQLQEACSALGIPLIYKGCFDKANRSSGTSRRGVGIDAGLKILDEVRRQTGLPVITDVHDESQIAEVASVVDVLQTPAFLCRQTDFIHAVAKSGARQHQEGPVPRALGHEERHRQGPCRRPRGRPVGGPLLACERGVSFWLQQPGRRHDQPGRDAQLRRPGGVRRHALGAEAGRPGGSSGGAREMVPVLARAGVGVGVVASSWRRIRAGRGSPTARTRCRSKACVCCWSNWWRSTGGQGATFARKRFFVLNAGRRNVQHAGNGVRAPCTPFRFPEDFRFSISDS